MREIKFNAYDSIEKDYIRFDDWLIKNDIEVDGKYTSHNEALAKFLDFHYGCDLLQYTGLKDKNGIDIYEGDIVYFKIRTIGNRWEETRYEVKFTNGSFMLTETFDITEFTRELRLWYANCEVIGNIYENPELLKDKE